ncbi:putative monovalent cation/H+ antiporter subunit B [Rickettsiales bacterium Ac37b]|nr:putative monovalent cation/H+ antiporter subunit B [Rickettsiales bacterium Ac37b]
MQINNIILKVITKLLLPFIMLLALYIQFNGEFSPGGGFQAGIIFASAFILYTMVFGNQAMYKIISSFTLKIYLVSGILMYIIVGIIPILFNKNFLTYSVLITDKLASEKLGIMLIELGIGITVFSSILLIFLSLIRRRY